jgi:hypothetical protein
MPVKVSIGCRGITADHPLAVKVGLDILEDGGNAFDAAISVSAVLSVVQPQMGGPGGDGFILGFIDDEIVAYASSGKSPSKFDTGRYLEEKPIRGPLTVTIPGLVHLWGQLYEEYASLPFDRLLKPAVDLAYNGFNAGWFLSNSSKSYEEELIRYEWGRYFKGIKLGDLVVNREMARTLKLISSNGWSEFYDGKLAEEIVSQLRNQGVDADIDDFRRHRCIRIKPLKMEVDEKILYELPPNTQGVSTLQLINALYELDMGRLPFDDKRRIEAWSRPVEEVYEFRDSDGDGLCEYHDGLESGWDNSPRWDKGRVEAVDLNSFLLLETRILAKMAEKLGLKDDVEYFRFRRKLIEDSILKTLYNDEDNVFYDVYPETHEYSRVLTLACFIPLWVGVGISENKARGMIEEYLLNPKHFYGEIPLPIVAYSDPAYEHNNFWRGPLWYNIAYIILQVLWRYGYREEAETIAEKLLRIAEKQPYIYEYYDSKTGEGLGAKSYGWTAATIIELILKNYQINLNI